MRAFLRLAFVSGLTCILVLVGLCLLPHHRYIRWQAVRTEAFARLGWVYERVHFDQTPTDVVFIGTSHTMNGVNGRTVAQGINAGRAGRCVTVTNLAVPSYGRNMHWAVARELLQNRPVKLLVIEVFENETRKAHPFFYQVADAGDVIGAEPIINLNYFNDMIRLPFRQASLFAKTIAPEQFGLHKQFSLAEYDGSDVDNTAYVNVGGQAFTPLRTKQEETAKLAYAARLQQESKNTNMLGERFQAIEYNFPNHYLGEILRIARDKGVPVRLLYLPGYGKPSAPMHQPVYQGYPMMSANDVLTPQSHWYDVDHLNLRGADILSRRLGEMLHDAPEIAGAGTPASCAGGAAQRKISKPFVKPDAPASH